jgi:hypothetical protein
MIHGVRRLARLSLAAAIAAVCMAAVAGAAPGAALAQPTTTASLQPAATASGWTLGPVAVTLSAVTDTPPITGTWYRPLGASAWITYGWPFSIATQGISTYQFFSGDVAPYTGEAVKTFTVRVDSSPPVSFSPLGVPKGWSKSPVTIKLRAGDALSGVARIEYRIKGVEAWSPYTGAFTISAPGVTTIEYRAIDNVGLVEATQSRTVSIDTIPPVTKAYPAGVKSGKKVKLSFQVNDSPAGSLRAIATVLVFRGTKKVKAFSPVAVNTNARSSVVWRCKLKPGTYKVKVLATDSAGNPQSRLRSAKLTVKE